MTLPGRCCLVLVCAALACLAGCGRGSGRPAPAPDRAEKGGAEAQDGGGRGRDVAVDERPWRTRENRLLTSAEAKAADPASFVVSPDGRHRAYAVGKTTCPRRAPDSGDRLAVSMPLVVARRLQRANETHGFTECLPRSSGSSRSA
jgi:hypothetical protein